MVLRMPELLGFLSTTSGAMNGFHLNYQRKRIFLFIYVPLGKKSTCPRLSGNDRAPCKFMKRMLVFSRMKIYLYILKWFAYPLHVPAVGMDYINQLSVRFEEPRIISGQIEPGLSWVKSCEQRRLSIILQSSC